MTIRFSLLALVLSIGFIACTSTNKPFSAKQYQSKIMQKWYVIKAASDKGDMPMPPQIKDPYFEYLADGVLKVYMDNSEDAGTYSVDNKTIKMSLRNDPIEGEITYLSKEHCNMILHDKNEDLYLFFSIYKKDDPKSVFTELTKKK